MENKFIPQAIEIVTQAIHEDNSKNYHEAFRLYKQALEHFMVGVKCTSSWMQTMCDPRPLRRLLHALVGTDEKNTTSKDIIMKRVEGYMTRAEQLRGMLEKETAPKAVAAAVDMDK